MRREVEARWWGEWGGEEMKGVEREGVDWEGVAREKRVEGKGREVERCFFRKKGEEGGGEGEGEKEGERGGEEG